MESVPLLPPPVSTRLVSSGPRGVSLKVLFSHNRRGVHQRTDTLCHRWWLKKVDSYAIQPLTILPISWQVFAATLEGSADLDVRSAEETTKIEFGETSQTSQNESKNVDPNLDALEDGQERRQGKRDAPRLRKKITIEFDALKPGTILTGKVKNTQRFGAFVDVGAFTNGLIHISNLTNKFVSSVEDIVQVGQEVKVEVLSVSVNPGRISLKLVREDEPSTVEKPIISPKSPEVQKRIPKFIDKERSSSASTGRPQKGEVITGSISKIASTGVVVSLKQGHEGFLPASEVLPNGNMVETTSFFRVGQQIPVRVLRTSKDRITLTMRKQARADENREDVLSSPEDRAASPFEIAFRRDKVIAKFLEERERLQGISSGKMDENPAILSTTEINQSEEDGKVTKLF